MHRNVIDGKNKVKVWIYFNSKSNRIKAILSPKALQRMNEKGINGSSYDDFVISESHINTLKHTNVNIKRRSRWLNAVSAVVNVRKVYELERFSFVKKIDIVRSYRRKLVPRKSGDIKPSIGIGHGGMIYNIDYGSGLSQLNNINLPILHELGFSGNNVLICMLDTGFKTDHHAFVGAKIISQRDFVNDDDIVMNETGDPYGAHDHGTGTLSLIAADIPGKMVGGAFNSSFILGKTEDVASETPIEEDNWVAGVEWADSLGADIISSSLGYMTWDDGSGYEYRDLDGVSAVTSIIAGKAAKRGILLVTSAGNEGPGQGTLSSPSDARDILSVGAVSNGGIIADFSSRGPTYDGRLKPEVSAQGVNCFMASGAGSDFFELADGTSFSAPLVAAAAALVMEAHPDWTPYQVIEAFTNTASQADAPDNEYGYGIINAYAATNYSFPTLPDGDINSDGNVDGHDLVILSISFGLQCGSDNWIPKADMDRNCTVDGDDLVIFTVKFQK